MAACGSGLRVSRHRDMRRHRATVLRKSCAVREEGAEGKAADYPWAALVAEFVVWSDAQHQIVAFRAGPHWCRVRVRTGRWKRRRQPG